MAGWGARYTREVKKAILLDLGNVIVPFEIERGYSALSLASGLAPEEVAQRIRDSGLYAAYESGQLPTAEFHRRFSALLGISPTIEELRELWNRIFLPQTAVSDELIAELGERYRLVLLSNTNELHFGWIRERYEILRHLDAFCLSYEVGAMKPEEKIYARAVELAGCDPEECFFTDDVERYVAGARLFGIDAEQFTGEAELRKQLHSRGLIA